MTTSSVISTRDMCVQYGNQSILGDFNLTIGEREFVSIAGSSGVGKSSLLHALAGFIPCVGNVQAPEHFGFVFQTNPVFPFLTVAGNVGLGVRTGTPHERSQRVKQNIESVGLEREFDRYPCQLSGGQVQRVALARAMAAAPEPQVLYCDEPFAALDIFTRERMQELLLSLWKSRSLAVLIVTHSIEEAIFLSDRVILLKDNSQKEEFRIEFSRPRKRELKFSRAFVDLQRNILDSMDSR